MIIDRNSPVPSYFQLQTWLIEQIEQGVFKPNDKIPTEQELQKITGLARATIRQAIQNLVNMGYLDRKRRKGTFVLNRAVTTERKHVIGILVPDIRKGYAPELARGAEDEAAKNRHSLILCNTDDLFVKAKYHANRLVDNAVSGVIFVPTAAPNHQNMEIVNILQRNQIPVVLADRVIEGLDIDFVTTNNFEGAYEITNYLISKGHRKIGIIVSTLFSTESLRLSGYKEALQDHGIDPDDSRIIADSGPFIESRYFQFAKKMLKSDITAIFAGHDRIALLIYAAAKEMGIRIPDDISVVGYDDLHFTTINLTTMHQPIYEMGQESLKLIMHRINGETQSPQHVELSSYLVERSSVKSLLNSNN